MKTKMQLENIHAVSWSEFSTAIAISGNIGPASYHIWIDRDTLKPNDDVIHRNVQTDHGTEYRELKQSAQCNREIVRQLLHAPASAVAGAKFKFDREQEKIRLQYEKQKRHERITAAAPAMHVALKE